MSNGPGLGMGMAKDASRRNLDMTLRPIPINPMVPGRHEVEKSIEKELVKKSRVNAKVPREG